MTKKGLSLEQKRDRILQIFLESDDVFQLKEIEKEGPKRGVTAQSIKEVVQSLVDDNLVHQVIKQDTTVVAFCKWCWMLLSPLSTCMD